MSASPEERAHVAAISGSLRDRSYTRLSLGVALEGVEAAGGTGELLDLRTFDLPPFDADVDSETVGDAAAFAERVRAADAVLLGTPVYHGSYSGVLKNAVDYCGFDEFADTTVGLLAVAGGSFPVTALEHLRSVCRALNAWVVPHQVAVPNASSRFDGRELVDEKVRERTRVLGRRVVQYARIEPDPSTFEGDQNVGAGD
jgi:NAD(P)H-dependent FMN reductase